MATTCIHGFAPGTCLICQTLQGGSATGTKRARAVPGTKSGRPGGAGGAGIAGAGGAGGGPAPAVVRPDAVVSGRGRQPRHSSLGLRLIGFVIVAVAVLVAVWVVVGFVLAILRILELVGVAVVAGWIGWSLGVRHGRRGSRT